MHGTEDLMSFRHLQTGDPAAWLIYVVCYMHSFEVGCNCIVPINNCPLLCALACRVSISLTEATTSLQHVDALLTWQGSCDGIELKWKF